MNSAPPVPGTNTIIHKAIERRSLPDLLAALPLLKDLSAAAIAQLAEEAQIFALPAGNALYEAGQAADALYILVNGALGMFVTAVDGQSQQVGVIAPGESAGEIALLSGRPHAVSVYTLRDSDVARLPAASFERLLLQDPATLRRIAAVIAQRVEALQNPAAGAAAPALRTIAIVPHDHSVDALAFARELARALGALPASGAAAAAGSGGPRGEGAICVTAAEGAAQISHGFHRIEQAHEFVIYVADPSATSWNRLCVRRADRALLVGRADRDPAGWPALQATEFETLLAASCEMVLLHPGAFRRGAAQRWLGSHAHRRAHHVVDATDTARVARLLAGRGVGVVLSGGGARGFAHIGVLRALQEARIPVDSIGGTSIGSIIAAGWAMGWPFEELRARIRRAFVEQKPLSDYTLPIVALVRGRKVSRLLREEFGDTTIEDLRIPFYCASTNLTTGKAALHRTGPLWSWLRAAIAIPGVLPPVLSGGQVFVDGATMNNLPVEEMRRLTAGPLIGVDVGVDRAFGAGLESVELPPLWRMHGWRRRAGPKINIMQVLLRAGLVNSAATTIGQRRLTDLLLTPPLEGIDLLDWKSFDRGVEAGYRHAAEHLGSFRIRLPSGQAT
jgi:NTE family protein